MVEKIRCGSFVHWREAGAQRHAQLCQGGRAMESTRSMLAALSKASGHGFVCFKLILQTRAMKSSKMRTNHLRLKAEEWEVGRKRAGQMPRVC